MTAAGEYTAYVTALQAVIDLPKAHAAQIESIEHRARAQIEALDRRRSEGAQRWTNHRDTSYRLSRRVSELETKVGSGHAGLGATEPVSAASIPAALDSLRADLERAEQSWQWLVRHRERARQVQHAPVPQPVYAAPSPTPVASAPPPVPTKPGVNVNVLIGVGAAVIVILVIVIVAMAI